MPYTLSDLFPGNYNVSQVYGARPAYYQQFGLRGHEGIDWAIPVGKQLYVPFAQAIVQRAGWDTAYGYYMVLWDYVQRCAVWYCHLSRYYYNAGARLNRFTVVGLTGRSGNVTGPHLHANLNATDAYGNRLNRNNGYQGFINMLDPRIARWTLSR